MSLVGGEMPHAGRWQGTDKQNRASPHTHAKVGSQLASIKDLFDNRAVVSEHDRVSDQQHVRDGLVEREAVDPAGALRPGRQVAILGDDGDVGVFIVAL